MMALADENYIWRDGYVNMDGDDVYVGIPKRQYTEIFADDLKANPQPQWHLSGDDPDDPRLRFKHRLEWGVEENYWGHAYVLVRYSPIWWEIDFWPIPEELHTWFKSSFD